MRKINDHKLIYLSVLPGFHGHFRKDDIIFPKWHREIILSYRLLFGQDKKSRKLFREIECKRAAYGDNKCDPLLYILCGTNDRKAIGSLPAYLWPDSCRDTSNKLLEQSSYSVSIDFPILSSRMMKIQDFDARQQPYRLMDYWRDRRNPLQWVAFWAVLIIGGLSIIIGVIQLIVACISVARS